MVEKIVCKCKTLSSRPFFYELIINIVKSFCIVAGDLQKFGNAYITQRCDFFCGIDNHRAVATLATERHGRHIRSVGFKQKPVKRNFRGDFKTVTGIFECNNTAEADVHSHTNRFTHKLNTARKAMNQRIWFVFSQKIVHITVSLTIVNYKRHFKVKRKPDLFLKNTLLQVFRNVPMIIKSCFADCDNLFMF